MVHNQNKHSAANAFYKKLDSLGLKNYDFRKKNQYDKFSNATQKQQENAFYNTNINEENNINFVRRNKRRRVITKSSIRNSIIGFSSISDINTDELISPMNIMGKMQSPKSLLTTISPSLDPDNALKHAGSSPINFVPDVSLSKEVDEELRKLQLKMEKEKEQYVLICSTCKYASILHC